MRKASGVQLFLPKRVPFVNSLRRTVRSGVHQGLDLREGRKRGAVASIVVVRAVRADENHWSSWLGEGVPGAGGICQSLSLLVRAGQSASCQHGLGLSLWGEGGVGRSIWGSGLTLWKGGTMRPMSRRREDMRVGEDHVDGARPVGAPEGQPGVDARGVQEGEASVRGTFKVGGGLTFFLEGEEPGGVGGRIADVIAACD